MSRRRFVYRKNPDTGEVESFEVASDFEASRGLTAPVSDLYMDGLRTADGVDIGSRAKRRAYMRNTGVADASDFTHHVAKVQAQRAEEAAGRGDYRDVAETVGRAAYAIQSKRRRR